VTLSILCGLWVIAYLYEHRGNMFQEERRGEIMYDPYSIDHFTPKEEMMIRLIYLPLLRVASKNTEADIIEYWLKLGHIPHNQFPEHLKPFLKGKKEKRF